MIEYPDRFLAADGTAASVCCVCVLYNSKTSMGRTDRVYGTHQERGWIFFFFLRNGRSGKMPPLFLMISAGQDSNVVVV